MIKDATPADAVWRNKDYVYIYYKIYLVKAILIPMIGF